MQAVTKDVLHIPEFGISWFIIYSVENYNRFVAFDYAKIGYMSFRVGASICFLEQVRTFVRQYILWVNSSGSYMKVFL